MVAMMILRALTGNLRGQEFKFRAPACCMLGRSLNCELRLPHDARVSRQHCLVEPDGAGAWVQDLGSLNGTHLNGVKIGQRQDKRETDATLAVPPRRVLRDGDELQVGDNLFAVVLSGLLKHVAPGEGQREAGILISSDGARIDGHLEWPEALPQRCGRKGLAGVLLWLRRLLSAGRRPGRRCSLAPHFSENQS